MNVDDDIYNKNTTSNRDNSNYDQECIIAKKK